MHSDRSESLLHQSAIAVVLVGVLALVGCAAGPEPTMTSTGDPTPEVTTPGASPSAEATTKPGADISIPASCEDIYSPEMLATLESENPPLNDPAVTMDSTEVVEALEVLGSGLQTLRCSWGLPSSYGLATNITIVDAAQAQTVVDSLPERGFACEELADGTVCRAQQSDGENSFGESHYLRANGWVSTRWINFGPQGYTEDIVSTLWG